MAFPEPLIDKHQLAALVGCSPRTVQEKCRTKQWPYTKPAGKLLFSVEHVRFIAALGETWPVREPAAPVDQQHATRSRRSRQAPMPVPVADGSVPPLRSRPAPRLAEIWK